MVLGLHLRLCLRHLRPHMEIDICEANASARCLRLRQVAFPLVFIVLVRLGLRLRLRRQCEHVRLNLFQKYINL